LKINISYIFYVVSLSSFFFLHTVFIWDYFGSIIISFKAKKNIFLDDTIDDEVGGIISDLIMK